jgi:predicted transcriptional regulator
MGQREILSVLNSSDWKTVRDISLELNGNAESIKRCLQRMSKYNEVQRRLSNKIPRGYEYSI